MTAKRSIRGSEEAYRRACALIPGGVNSPVRAFKGVGGTPIFIDHAAGARLYDVDGNEYIDYVGSWGPAIVGHANEEVVQAVTEAAQKGLSYGAPTPAETELAEKIRRHVPSMEKVRLVSSGTEACMSALRLARAFTGRDKIVKFTGCYHGHADMLLVKAGSGALTLGLSDCPGVPADATRHTLVARYNDVDGIARLFSENEGQIAAVILEPIIGNSGFIRPTRRFLEALRELTEKAKALLIFDEVMTGFRVGMGGVQGLMDIRPDLTTLGKVIGGGLPLAAYGGRADIMALVAPDGAMYQAGTLSGNPLAVAAGLKTLEILERPQSFAKLTALMQQLINGLKGLAATQRIPFMADGEGGMFGFFFHGGTVASHEDARGADLERFKQFFHAMLARGIYLAPSAFEAGFVSLAHEPADVEATLAAAEAAFKEIG